MMVRELGFEMKAQPSNRMKTEEELAREEQERLRRLEVLAGLGALPWEAFYQWALYSLRISFCLFTSLSAKDLSTIEDISLKKTLPPGEPGKGSFITS